MLLLLLLLSADAPPPPVAPTAPPHAWACDRATLLKGQRCTFEGTAAKEQASAEKAKEQQEQTRAFGLELCAAASSSTPAVKAACDKQLEIALLACVHDGSRALLDVDGRFNPGTAACYSSFRALVALTQRTAAEAKGCCSCLGPSSFDSCVAASFNDALPAISEACTSSCAALILRVPKKK